MNWALYEIHSPDPEYKYTYVCVSVYHSIYLDFKNGLRNQGSFVRCQSIQKENKRTLTTQIMCEVENFKPGRNPVSYRKPGVYINPKFAINLQL